MLDSYFIAAIAIVICFIILRFMIVRWRNEAFFDFLRTGSNDQDHHSYSYSPPENSDYRSMYHGLQLAPVPAAYHPTAVRAPDTDAFGRRLGPGGEDWSGKDLPAYDNLDRPPKYVETSWSQPWPLQPAEQSAVPPSTNGEESGTEAREGSAPSCPGVVSPVPHHAHTLPSS